jgi:hypothetical protein
MLILTFPRILGLAKHKTWFQVSAPTLGHFSWSKHAPWTSTWVHWMMKSEVEDVRVVNVDCYTWSVPSNLAWEWSQVFIYSDRLLEFQGPSHYNGLDRSGGSSGRPHYLIQLPLLSSGLFTNIGRVHRAMMNEELSVLCMTRSKGWKKVSEREDVGPQCYVCFNVTQSIRFLRFVALRRDNCCFCSDLLPYLFPTAQLLHVPLSIFKSL